MISRFYSHYSGEIFIDGVSIHDYQLSHLRQSISIVNQSPTLFNDTIEKNIAYGDKSIDVDKLKESAKLSGCEEFINNLPEGYESIIGDDGVLLSGGQRQRLSIARAIAKDSPILILDEATSALDSATEKLVQSAINKMQKGRTTIIIAHRLSTIKNADRIIVLKDGEIIEQGTHSELIEASGEYLTLTQQQT